MPNEYQVKWLKEPLVLFSLLGRHTIQFVNRSEDHIDLPNPKHLMIHAAIAKVLHASGVGDVLDLIMDRFNTGSSAVTSGKFDGNDLEIRLSLLSLAGTNYFNLPTNINDH